MITARSHWNAWGLAPFPVDCCASDCHDDERTWPLSVTALLISGSLSDSIDAFGFAPAVVARGRDSFGGVKIRPACSLFFLWMDRAEMVSVKSDSVVTRSGDS